MQRKIVYDREWLAYYAPKYLADHERKIGGRVTELTVYGAEVPIERECVDAAFIVVEWAD